MSDDIRDDFDEVPLERDGQPSARRMRAYRKLGAKLIANRKTRPAWKKSLRGYRAGKSRNTEKETNQ